MGFDGEMVNIDGAQAMFSVPNPFPWRLFLKRGYIYPCQNIDAYDFEVTFQQIAMDIPKKNVCPPEQLELITRLVNDMAKLEVVQSALEWPMYLCQYHTAKDKSFGFPKLAIVIDQRGLHVVNATNDKNDILLSCKYDDLIVKETTEASMKVIIEEKEYDFTTKGLEVKNAIDGYVLPLKLISGTAIAISNFPGYTPDHLPLQKGALVQVLDRDPENGWLQGQIGDKIGWFPLEFVEILLDEVANDASGKPIMRAAAIMRSAELEKKLSENENEMVKFSAMSSDKYSLVEFAKINFDERNFVEATKKGAMGTIRALTGTLRKKNMEDVMKSMITDELVTKALSWVGQAPKYPMTRFANNDDLNLMTEGFQMVMSYMGDLATKRRRADIAMNITGIGMSKEEFRDEIYIQIIKQVTNNKSPKTDSGKKGWDLLILCSTFLVPSTTFEPYLRAFFHSCSSNVSKEISNASHECDVRLTKSKIQPRNLPPLEQEIEAIELRRQLPLRVMFPEDASKNFLFDSHTTSKEVLKKIFEKYDLLESNEYGLYVVLSTGFGTILNWAFPA